MRVVKIFMMVFIIAALIFATGCAAKKMVKKTPPPDDMGTGMVEEEPMPVVEEPPFMEEEKPIPEPVIDEPVQAGLKYIVKLDDTLWGISSKGNIYEDAFRWPLLYKSNRDQVKDPDLIYPGQELDVRTDYSSTEINDAVEKAKDTPAYLPHTAPRKKLPLRY